MRRGAVALIDVLGFKGIWRRHSEDAVIRSLQALLKVAEEDARLATAGPDNMIDFIAPLFLSDTVVFGLAAKSPADVNAVLRANRTADLVGSFDEERTDSWTVWHMGNFLAHLMRQALVGEVPFAFRGAVAFGRFGLTDRFLIGEAIDEAATFHERPDGAIVGLAPSAARFEQAAVPSSVSKFVKYPIPTKARGAVPAGTWNTWAVVPLGEVEDPAIDLKALFSHTLTTNDDRLREDVDRKRENTLAFLQFSADAEAAPMREMLQQVADLARPARR
jgi:hypothetical protein